VLLRLDSLAGQASALTTEHRTQINETVENLNLLSRQLNHFAEEITKRPYRLLTGVKPYLRDTLPPRPDSTTAIRP